ncbi:S26 family signal peptidase [Campylobacter ureolyticus]|uniref:S26 family signal peptidase n=1 Tax=Campylobacter ureolyticus TaxID=827 RepID=UPI001FC84219|nr:S26 family signal peptidase [Campylobacter ureolyticus]MCZ6106046.1 S26 family signal peptidase [Campylobacter ureolyticus]MCZ6158744.1 S26 family signal peptidase [Campylobacter ureolyticus]GKH61387.1 hypothetical protein CE91St25_17230 [Campylobacter ureolyticus]
MPLGIYQILNEHPVKGDIIIFKIPQKQVRLLKKIVAAGGNTVVTNNDGMFVDGIKIKNSDMQKFDSKNNPLKFVAVNKILSYNEILVAGEHKKAMTVDILGLLTPKK